ncbi:MAG: hypothetical protein LUD27_08145 [Clostridia bacterium]|nr:hypothetical protein [Clostridia bacterium]
MAAFKLSLKNLYRNFKYTSGLFVVFLITAVMCVSFITFSDMSEDAYGGLLSRQASTSYVSLSFKTMTLYDDDGNVTYNYKGDMSAEDLKAVKAIDGVEDVYRFCADAASCKVSLDGGDKMEMQLWPLLFDGGDIPEQFIEEYGALYGGSSFVCGGRIDGRENGCLVSEAFADLVGAEDAESLLGKTLATFIDSYGIYADEFGNKGVEITETEYLAKLVICGVLSEKFSEISFMEDYGENFIFADTESLVYQSSFPNVYLAYGDYDALESIKEAAESLNISGASVSSGNESYAMRKLSQMSRFISAVLALIAAICLFAAVAVIAGVAMLKFAKNRSFYCAAFAVGLSRTQLALSFLYEFLIVALAAFVVSLPLGVLLVNGLAGVLELYLSLTLEAGLSLSAALYSLIPLAAAGLVSAAIVRIRLACGG